MKKHEITKIPVFENKKINIGALPIIENDSIIGIVTRKDLLKTVSI